MSFIHPLALLRLKDHLAPEAEGPIVDALDSMPTTQEPGHPVDEKQIWVPSSSPVST